MAIMLFSAPVDLPAGLLARSLAKHLPAWRWQVGDVFGTGDELLPLVRKQVILGRNGEELVFCTIEPLEHQPLTGEGLPPHRYHLQIGQPTTEDRFLGLSLSLLVAAGLVEGGTRGVWLDIGETGNWLPASEMEAAIARIGSRFDIGELLMMGRPTGSDWGEGLSTPARPPAPAQEATPEPVAAEPEPEPVYAEQPTAIFRHQTRSFGRKGL